MRGAREKQFNRSELLNGSNRRECCRDQYGKCDRGLALHFNEPRGERNGARGDSCAAVHRIQ